MSDACVYPSMADCLAAAAQALVDGCAVRDRLAATHGTEAVGEAAWYPGHPLRSPEAIANHYWRMTHLPAGAA